MLVSVLGYFIYIIAAFATIMTLLLIGSSNGSTLQEDLRHYPRPMIEPIGRATNDSKHSPAAHGTRPDQPGKDSDVISVAGTKSHAHGGFANVQKFARQHENNERYGHAVVLSYSEKLGYSPGLEDQR